MTPFSAQNMADITRLRDRSIAIGDQVKAHRSDPSIMLVTAQSMSTDQAQAWYKVNIVEGTCTCKGFKHFANCRHLCRVSWELHLAKQRPANVVDFKQAA